MLRAHRRLIDRIGIIVSGGLIFFSFWSVHNMIRRNYGHLESFNHYKDEIAIFMIIVLVSMIVREVSAYKRFSTFSNLLKEIFICYLFGILGFTLFTYIFKIPRISRIYLFGGIISSYVAVSIFYLIHSFVYRQIRALGLNYQSVLLVGNEYTLPPFINTIKNNKSLGLHIIGVMTLEETDKKNLMGYRCLGGVDNIRKVLNAEAIDYVIFTIYRQDPIAVEKAMLICQERGIDTWFKPDFMQKIIPPRIDYLEDIPLFIISLSPKSAIKLMVKRFLDILISLFLIIILAVPMLMIALLIRSTTKGAAIFKQKRIGLNGRKFIMYKFRTMHTEIQQRRSEYKLKNEMIGPVFKMKEDPRITSVGRILRRFSLDELPQFFNVLKGDMSIVGPRPPLPKEVNLYKGWQRRRLSMRPGITCIWQVTGRNKITDFEEWVKLDLRYIDTWGLWLDFKILLKTIPAVIIGTGY